MFVDASEQMKVEDLSIFGQVDLHPIIFEDCYVKDNDQAFLNLVMTSPEVITETQLLNFDKVAQQPFM